MERSNEVMKYWSTSVKRSPFIPVLLLIGMILATEAFAQIDPLPSWNDGPVKQRILKFVEEATKENGPNYVQPAECIAVFDTDGTLWPENKDNKDKGVKSTFDPFLLFW